MEDRIVLLFFHGGSFTKECWKPIIKRLNSSALLQRVPCEFVTLDWRFHGERSDYSVDAKIDYLHDDCRKPRVDHPLRVWMEWVPAELTREIAKLRRSDGKRKTRIIGIGHSMGATAMLDFEIHHPGTFDGIVAFEPVNHHGKSAQEQAAAVTDMLVSITLNRPGEWSNSWDEAVDHFKNGKMYRRWHPEAIDAFLEQGVRKTVDGTFRLATSPSQEASIYCHTPLVLDWAQLGCTVTIEYAARSHFFNAAAAREVAKRFPHKLSVGHAIPNTTHSMVLEDPDMCAQHILLDLERLPVFQASSKL